MSFWIFSTHEISLWKIFHLEISVAYRAMVSSGTKFTKEMKENNKENKEYERKEKLRLILLYKFKFTHCNRIERDDVLLLNMKYYYLDLWFVILDWMIRDFYKDGGLNHSNLIFIKNLHFKFQTCNILYKENCY